MFRCVGGNNTSRRFERMKQRYPPSNVFGPRKRRARFLQNVGVLNYPLRSIPSQKNRILSIQAVETSHVTSIIPYTKKRWSYQLVHRVFCGQELNFKHTVTCTKLKFSQCQYQHSALRQRIPLSTGCSLRDTLKTRSLLQTSQRHNFDSPNQLAQSTASLEWGPKICSPHKVPHYNLFNVFFPDAFSHSLLINLSCFKGWRRDCLTNRSTKPSGISALHRSGHRGTACTKPVTRTAEWRKGSTHT